MNGTIVVAQAGSSGNSGAAPVQVIKLTKPLAGQTEIFHASFTGTVKIDFTAIANEQITLFHDSKTQSLHVIFADGSQDIIEPFFDSRGTVLSNLIFEMGPNQIFDGVQFASQFPITEDQSVLPAAGPGGVASGADFLDAVVDPLLTGPVLPLLPPESFPGITFTGTEAPAFIEESNTNLLPTVSGHVLGIVEEEALNAQVIEQPSDSGQGNEDTRDLSGNDHDTSATGPGSQITTQTFNGTLAGLVTGGNLPITFLANSAANGTTVHDNNGNPLTSIGQIVHYVFVDSSDMEGRTPDNRLIFTLHVNTDGTFTFTLNDQIDHPFHSHDFSHGALNAQGGLEETLDLDLSTAVVAHDATPDAVVFPTNTVDVGVIDDTPIAFDSVPFYPQPDVEGGGSFSTALDDEDQANGIQGGPGDNGFGTSLSGVLNFRPGADNFASVSFGTNLSVSATDGVHTTPLDKLQAIWVDGSGVGHKEDVTLIWVADGSGGGALTGSTTHIADAFTLTVDKFGDYTFNINAPLSHPFTADPNNPSSNAFEDTLNLVFTYTATDGDGDQADAFLTINVNDDVPTLCLTTNRYTTVTEDETPGIQHAHGADDVSFSSLPSTIQALFSGIVNKGFDPDVNNHDNGALGYAAGTNGLVNANVHFGADGASATQAEVFALTLPGGNGTDSGLQTTEGQEIYLFLENGVIVGRYDAPNDPAAFAITVDPTTGEAYVAQYVSLHHNSPDIGHDISEGDFLASGTVFISVTATDGDGDSVTKTTDVSREISFLDDGPTACVSATSAALIIDETAGQDAGTNDVATTPALLALFAALPGSPIQIAQSSAALFTTNSDFGADGPGAPPSSVFGLNVVNGTDSGLNATDGRSIYLYHEGNLIVGREGDVGTDAANAAGPVALAFSMDGGTGTLTLAEYTAIQHPNPLDPNEAGSPQTITNSALQVTFTITDGDGDVSTASAGIGSLIQFRDDGPSITPPSNLIVNGSFEEGHPNLVGTDWDIYSSLPGWTYGADHIPFEVQTGGAGGIAAEDGLALIELDGDRVGNPAHQPPSATPDPHNTDATIQQVISGTQAGVDYELTFWYTPRPGHSGGNDDGLDVLWNGNVVHTIDSTGQPEGVWQQITLFVTGTGPGDTLGFKGEGDQDEFGALIDNVSLIQAVVVDEDGLPNGNHDSQPGDIVVPNSDGDNNEATSTGYLNINWGADNFDAAPDTHVGGNPALGFVQDSGGRSVTFTDATVGITGGALTSHGDAITLTLSADHTVLTGTAQGPHALPRTVFEVSLSDDNTGAFRFILQDALDHATGNNENNIMLTFDFTATDSDGDPALGHFQVLVNDDMPVAVNDVDSVVGVGQHATGNVITGIDFGGGDVNTTDGNADHVGADGPGTITQLTGFGGTDNSATPRFQVDGEFGTLFLAPNGNYDYTRTSTSGGIDHFTYTLSDHDGDTSVASLDITVSPAAHDDAVITNIAGSGAAIGIPDLALLLNDIDIPGAPLNVLSVGAATSGAVGHAATTTTFTDDNLDGGSFNYTVEDNGTPNLTSTAHVTIDRLQAGHSELDGTSANEILIGTTSADTLVGNGGSDILVGNGGANHYLYNATTDGGTIANQAGADHILDFSTVLGDSIDVLASAFGGGLVAGTDASGIFGSSANDTFGGSTERFHFNTSTHMLLYDSNGSVAGGTQVALAHLENGGAVDQTHIHMV